MDFSKKNIFVLISAGCIGLFGLIRVYYLLRSIFNGYFTFKGYYTAVLFAVGLIVLAIGIYLENKQYITIGLGVLTLVEVIYVIKFFEYGGFEYFSDVFYFIFYYLLEVVVFALPLYGTITDSKYKNLCFIGGGLFELASYVLCSIIFELIYYVIIYKLSFSFSFLTLFTTLLLTVGLASYGLSVEKK